MKEEVRSSGTIEPYPNIGRSASPPPTPAASSAGASSPAMQTNIGSTDWFGTAQVSKASSRSGMGPQPPRASFSTNAGCSTRGSSQPSCRPWEQGDLLRRLATFNPTNWSAKNKGVGALACGRRGWVNVDIDKIECEACGAHLTYAALSSLIPEVDSAGEALSEQFDAGHKVTCPWKGNCCAESLVQFPPTPPSALIGGFRDRCDGLLQFLQLPVIASSAIETIKLSRSMQIDQFMSLSHAFYSDELGFKADSMPPSELYGFYREEAFCSYPHAQKLISLCGWEPRWLPSVQDCEEHSAQSTKNASSFDPTGDELGQSHNPKLSMHTFFSPLKKEKVKEKKSAQESTRNLRSPLLDCSLCGASVRIWDFHTVPQPARFGPSNIGNTDINKKQVLTRGASAASGINGWVTADGMEKEHMEGRDEAATTDDGKSLSNAGVDLNLTMAGGLPSTQSVMPVMTEPMDDGGMGRNLIIGQPSGSEVGDRAASYESRGPSARKRNLEEGGSTVDRPHDRVFRADSIEGTVVDRETDEIDDECQDSDGPSKRSRGLDIFDTYHSLRRVDSSGAGPSHILCLDIDIDVNKVDAFKEGTDFAVGHLSTRDSTRASSVIAMDTFCHNGGEDSAESVENYPGDFNDVHLPSPSIYRNLDMNDALEQPNYSNQAQQSTYVPPAAGSVAREMGGSSTNEGEEILNAETAMAYGRDRQSIGISGCSVGMGASHEAEIHGVDVSVHRTGSFVGDAEPVAEVTENLGQTGESIPGPGLMDEFVPEEMGREDPQGDSQDVISRAVGKADSGSKVCGSTKADSTESGKNMVSHPSLSYNAIISSGYGGLRDEVTQNGKASGTNDCAYVIGSGPGLANGENDFEAEAGEFDPIKHHNSFCPWVNGNVAAAGCNIDSDTGSSSAIALCGWQLTLDALNNFQSLGRDPNQTMQSESAASQYKDDHLTPRQKLLTRRSVNKTQG